MSFRSIPSHEESDEVVTEDKGTEYWENTINELLPKDLFPTYAVLVATMKMTTRIKLLQLLDILLWAHEKCVVIYDVLHREPSEVLRGNWVDASHTMAHFKIDLYIYITSNLKKHTTFTEFVTCKENVFQRLLDVAFYLSKNELDNMIYLMQELSVVEVNAILDRTNEPMAKQCRLCRSKRIHHLEVKLYNNQADPHNITSFLPGLAREGNHCGSGSGNAARLDMWVADDESGFTFDVTGEGAIFWMRDTRVDMISICDTCLMEVHKASACITR